MALTNEFAGSDGDIFSHCFKLFGLGTLVGKRTWGGVIGIWPRHSLVDGTITTQPEFSFWFMDVGYGVENYGTDPDIEVDIAPHQFRDGEDPQMDKAIALILQETKAKPFSLPDFSERPSLPIPAAAGRNGSGNGGGDGRKRRVLKAPKLKSTSKTGSKASPKTSTKNKAKTATKAGTKAESKTAVKTRAKTKPKPKTKTQPKAKPKAKPKTKSRAGAGGSARKKSRSK